MLIAPLDWGLGHATRCIPLIEKFLIAGFKVIIAAEGDQKILLQSAFPALEIVHLQGYRLKYGTSKWQTIFKIILQIPKILIAINSENKWLRNFIKEKHLDVVIADNRYGLHHCNTISVFVTHQLAIKTSLGKLADALVQKMNYHFINQFNYCWVPDAAGETNLAGALSHPLVKPSVPLFYTGVLSRIQKENIPVTNQLLILLSGPEPQRSVLENILLLQLQQYNYPAIMVRGLPSANNKLAVPGGVTVYNHLTGLQLQRVINESEIIISRSGYSTMMDVLPLGKKCMVIPTPGQAEQEYLAKFLGSKKYVCVGVQHNFSLPKTMEETKHLQAGNFAFLKNEGLIEKAIAELTEKIERKYEGVKKLSV